jgi:hypothetical protein
VQNLLCPAAQEEKTDLSMAGIFGFPPIGQKTLDGWCTSMFHPSPVGNAGDGLKGIVID